MTVDSYLGMVDDRIGALFGCAARLGALAVSEDADLAEGLDRFGAKIGSARQLAEDYLTLWPAGERDMIQQGRMITKKKNLPVVHAFEKANPRTKRLLGEMYMQRVLEPSVLDEVARLCESAGGREFAKSGDRPVVGRVRRGPHTVGTGPAGVRFAENEWQGARAVNFIVHAE